MMDMHGLYEELERLQNLSESLQRSIEYRDMEESVNQPDRALVGHLTESIAALADRVSAQGEIPAILPDDDLPIE